MGDHCEQTMRKLSVYIDRELSDAEVRSVKAHLDDCPPCEKVFDFQAEMKRLVRKECCTDDAPARLRDWVRQLATEKPPARDREA
jgi:mycothiol system anti-sigma-R factor